MVPAVALAGSGARGLGKGKTGIIVGSVLVLFILIGVLAPPPEEKDAAAPATQPAATTERATDPTTEATVTTEPEPTTEAMAPTDPDAEEPAPDADTGRMSDGEYETFQRSLAEIDAEMVEYGEKLGKCSVLLQALELADASECIGDAYSGTGNSLLAAYATTEDLEPDVSKQCLKALKLYKRRLDVFYGYMQTTVEAGENLQFDEFTVLAKQSGARTKRYRQARDWVLTDCEPR